MKLLVSIHDVTPAHDAAVQRMWTYCQSVGVTPALLVVPNWHGEWPLADFRLFVQWLRDCHGRNGSGAEVFVHGHRHDELGLRRQMSDELRAAGRTAREAEFLTLPYAAARTRIESGLTQLRDCKLSPVGFVSPAWLSHRDVSSAVRDTGLRVSEDVGSITLHSRGVRMPSPVIRWSTRKEWRAAAGIAVARLSTVAHRQSWMVRIALHPGDVDHAPTWHSARETIERWLGLRQPWKYGTL